MLTNSITLEQVKTYPINPQPLEEAQKREVAREMECIFNRGILTMHYLPAQDELAESSMCNAEVVRDIMKGIMDHLEAGFSMGLNRDEIFIHDILHGFVTNGFNKKVLNVARKATVFLYYLCSVKDGTELGVLVSAFVKKVREIIDEEGLDNMIPIKDSIVLSYLCEYAEWFIPEHR